MSDVRPQTLSGFGGGSGGQLLSWRGSWEVGEWGAGQKGGGALAVKQWVGEGGVRMGEGVNGRGG